MFGHFPETFRKCSGINPEHFQTKTSRHLPEMFGNRSGHVLDISRTVRGHVPDMTRKCQQMSRIFPATFQVISGTFPGTLSEFGEHFRWNDKPWFYNSKYRTEKSLHRRLCNWLTRLMRSPLILSWSVLRTRTDEESWYDSIKYYLANLLAPNIISR